MPYNTPETEVHLSVCSTNGQERKALPRVQTVDHRVPGAVVIRRMVRRHRFTMESAVSWGAYDGTRRKTTVPRDYKTCHNPPGRYTQNLPRQICNDPISSLDIIQALAHQNQETLPVWIPGPKLIALPPLTTNFPFPRRPDLKDQLTIQTKPLARQIIMIRDMCIISTPISTTWRAF